MAADEAVGGATEGKSKAEEVVEEATSGGVEDVCQHDVHGVFGANGTGAEHGEAELHGEDEVSRKQEVGTVHGKGGVGESAFHSGKSVADEARCCRSVCGVGTEESGQLLHRAFWQRGHGEAQTSENRLREREQLDLWLCW